MTKVQAIETMARVEDGRLLLEEALPEEWQGQVRVLVFGPDENGQPDEPNDVDNVSPQQWQYALASNPAFAFLNDSAEDIYTWDDGRPLENASP